MASNAPSLERVAYDLPRHVIDIFGPCAAWFCDAERLTVGGVGIGDDGTVGVGLGGTETG